MLFDPLPKKDKNDLYNRETELEKFKTTITYSSLIIIQGLRRTGKTSFMNVALQESQQPYIILDMRGLSFNPSQADLVKKLESAFNQLDRKWLTRLISTLKQINGVSLLGNSISLDWSKKGVDLATYFDQINSWAKENGSRFILAFDEVQLIRGDKQILNLFAHIFDYNQNICIVVTGSEIGLLFDFLALDDPESPLFGRHYTEITMRNFSENESKEFLRKGFDQINLNPPDAVLDHAVNKLNGTAGWLTLYGARCRDQNEATMNLVDAVVIEGGKLARSEANKIVKYSQRYGVVLNHLANVGTATWTQIKSILEAREGRTLANSTVSAILNKLVKISLVQKNGAYAIPDPLLIHGLRENPIAFLSETTGRAIRL